MRQPSIDLELSPEGVRPAASRLESYRKMFLIRTAEEQLVALYVKNKIMSFVHFCIGQEAVPVGVCDVLTHEDDRILGNHRSHGHYLAKGGDLTRMVRELLGRANGASHGKGGSMHLADLSVNFVGSTPILGSAVPLACGTAFAQKYRKKGSVTAVFYGDGSSEEGVVYETYNLAALFKLPLLLVIENNLLAVSSKLQDRRSAKYDVEKIVTGFGLSYARADGNDYDDVLQKARVLVAGARAGNPAVLECVTYRHMAHSAPIFDEGCRDEDVLERRQEKDCLRRMRKTLLSEGVSEEEISATEENVKNMTTEVIQSACNSDFPRKETLYTDLYGS